MQYYSILLYQYIYIWLFCLLLCFILYTLIYTTILFPFIGITPPFITFRDAGFCINTFPITVLDCARAMRKAVSLGHFHYKSFNPTAFHQLAKLQNGDFSWIIPGKFLAFSGPITKYVCALPSSTFFYFFYCCYS